MMSLSVSAQRHRAWIRCPIRFNPYDTVRFLSPPPLDGTSSAFCVALKMVSTAASSQSQSGSTPKRPVCPSCSKPLRTCLCDRIHSPGLDNSVGVTILQHSLEKKHPLNSTRIVKLGFKNVKVATVSDVNFDARFSIWMLGKESDVGPAQKGVNCSDSGQEVEITSAQNQESWFLDGVSLGGRENVGKFEGEMLVDSPEAKNIDLVNDREGSDMWRQNGEGGAWIAQDLESIPDCREPFIDIFMGKKGVISSIKQTLKTDIHHERSKFDDVLELGLARGVFSEGFVVRKLQRRQVNQSLELEEYKEFVLKVPSGSVLLFPTEKALSIDELKASNFEVKNLIVLDGTWLKARRMYSENPWLRFLPHLKLDPQVMSLYREVRSQPGAGCLSTLESIIYTLKALADECSESLDNLLEVFGSMVEDQRRCKHERLNKVPAKE